MRQPSEELTICKAFGDIGIGGIHVGHDRLQLRFIGVREPLHVPADVDHDVAHQQRGFGRGLDLRHGVKLALHRCKKRRENPNTEGGELALKRLQRKINYAYMACVSCVTFLPILSGALSI